MYSFRELRKSAKRKEQPNGKETRLAVLGNCATQFFSDAIRGYCNLENMNVSVFDADYNQIDSQLLNPESEVYTFRPDIVLLYISTDKIYEEFLDLRLEERSGFADLWVNRLIRYWDLIASNAGCRIIQMGFTEIDDKVLGQFSGKVESTFVYQIRELNYRLQREESKRSDVYPVDLLAIQLRLGTRFFYDASLYYNAKMPVSMDALPYVAKAVVDVLKAMNGTVKKCVICDLDNTLWGGVVGDDGIGGIEIGELGRGHAFTNLQRWLKQLKECGIILAVCSKNNEDTAKKPFEQLDDMVLKLSDFSVFVANWEDKASNIKLIRETLNIGMDSIVFLDDNPFERNLVRQMIPEIEVPELPEDPALYLEYLQEQNYFETASFTGTDADRTARYQAEYERKKLEQTFESIDDYLMSLEMVGEMCPFEPAKYTRIAELSQRSNQFNLRTVRYTENEISKIAEDDRYITAYYTLKDRFGDHGLVSVVIIRKESDTVGFVDTWFMSCRVLKRGMEEFILNGMVRVAAGAGLETLEAEYIPTAKNAMVKDIYGSFGFTEISENHYRLKLADYEKRKTYIRESASRT